CFLFIFIFFFSSRRRHTRSDRDWSSDVCSSDLKLSLRLLLSADDLMESIKSIKWILKSIEWILPLRLPGEFWIQASDTIRNSLRSEERRVGKECRSRWSRYNEKKKNKKIEEQCM